MKSPLLHKPEDFFPVMREEAEVDNLLNNDVYKILMMDFILAHPQYSNLQVRWKMTVRNPDISLGKVIPQEKLESQFQMTRDAIDGISPAQASYLRGFQTNSGKQLLRNETLEYLTYFKLPHFSIKKDKNEGYEIEFEWTWQDSMMWEIFGLKIVNTLYLSEYIKKEKISDIEFTQMMNQTLGRLFEDIKTLKTCPEARFSEFGTRRSMSTNYQRLINEILQEQLPEQYSGTSNVMIASEMGSNNPIGTNAHELRMIPTALKDHGDDIINEMYEIDRLWAEHFPELAILLPDTYGTSFYLHNCPSDIRSSHTGIRFDSKDPNVGIPEYLNWLKKHGENPLEKIGIPSDGLTAQKIVEYTNKYRDTLMALPHGIGTHLTNNTKWTWPRESQPHGAYGSMSVVIKPSEVYREDLWKWVSTVKLSDNPNKAVWSRERVQLFKKIFWTKGMEVLNVSV